MLRLPILDAKSTDDGLASVLRDEIYTFSEGFVEDFQILGEQTANGVLSLQVKARVKANRLNKALFLNGLDVRKVYAWIGEPRVLIRLEETIDGENSSLHIAATSLENLFREKGIAVFRMRQGVPPENRVADSAGRSEQSPAPGRPVDAEIVLSGRCVAQFSRALTVGSYTLNFYSTRLDIQAINGATAEVLLSASYRSDDRTDTSAQSKFDAASQSMTNCIDRAKEDILFNIVRNWYDGFSKPTTHQLTVANVDYDQLTALKRKLMGIEGVRKVFERGYAERTAQLDVKYEGIQDGLVDAFLLLNLPYAVVAKAQNRLALEHR